MLKPKIFLIILSIGVLSGLVPLTSYNAPGKASAAKEGESLSNISTMQEMTDKICANSYKGESRTLIDTRDGSDYTVARLSDGNCWMTQNLRLTKEGMNTKGTTITSDNTNAPASGFTALPASAPSGFTGSNPDATYYSGDKEVGAYYSWYTATAHTGTINTPANTDASGRYSWRAIVRVSIVSYV